VPRRALRQVEDESGEHGLVDNSNDPYVQKIMDLAGDRSLFEKSPDQLLSLRKSLFRDLLSFLSKHSSHYRTMFERLRIDPKSADLQEDLPKVILTADTLRGEAWKSLVVDGVEQGGLVFSSSGTTQKEPVQIYRSPTDLEVMTRANTNLFEFVYGDILKDGVALFMAAPELKDQLNFVAFVDMCLNRKGIELIYGMRLLQGEGAPWSRLVQDRSKIVKFFKSKKEPKLFFTAPAGVFLICKNFEEMSSLKRLLGKLVAGAPPVSLRTQGIVVTGGGSKGILGVPEYGALVKMASRHFVAQDTKGTNVPAPFMDVYGCTETLTAILSRFGSHYGIPHPLQHVFLVDPRTYKPLKEGDGEGVLGFLDLHNTSFLGTFYPGDIFRSHKSNLCYGQEFSFVRRLQASEGWSLQRACGGALEELMSRGT
jgi:phenylacetate-CoA ligase